MSFQNNPPSSTAGRRAASLIVKQGPQIGIQFPLPREDVVVGREETCDIIIQDAEASRQHIQIRWESNAFVLHDLGSTNGTFVNGLQVVEPVVLNAGDTIGLGQTTLIFQDETSRVVQPDYVMPNDDRYFSEPDSAEPIVTKDALQRMFLGGCGCGILVFVCAVVVPGTMHLTGIIDLTEITTMLGF